MNNTVYVGGWQYYQFKQLVDESGMSLASKKLWWTTLKSLAGPDGPAQAMLDTIADVLPIALSVAGAILVVTLGWRLFRNFTHG